MSFTLVTALININRDRWSHYSRTFDEYLMYFKNILRIDAPMVIFVEEELKDFVYNCRKGYSNTLVKVITLSDYVLYSKLDQITAIQNRSEYKSVCVDKVCPEVCIPMYNVVVNNKVEFMQRASTLNPFTTDFFIWLDAGYGHNKFYIPEKFQWMPTSYLRLAQNDQIVINTLFDKMKSETPFDFFKDHQDFIDGGMFVGSAKALQQLHIIYYSMINDIMSQNIIDDDQYFMAMTYSRNRDLFKICRIPSWAYRKDIILS